MIARPGFIGSCPGLIVPSPRVLRKPFDHPAGTSALRILNHVRQLVNHDAGVVHVLRHEAGPHLDPLFPVVRSRNVLRIRVKVHLQLVQLTRKWGRQNILEEREPGLHDGLHFIRVFFQSRIGILRVVKLNFQIF